MVDWASDFKTKLGVNPADAGSIGGNRSSIFRFVRIVDSLFVAGEGNACSFCRAFIKRLGDLVKSAVLPRGKAMHGKNLS